VKVVLAPAGNQNKLKPLSGTARAGKVTFTVTNQANRARGAYNTPEAHELVVLRTNLPPNKLKVDPISGTVVETGRVGQPLAVDPGKTRTITLSLKPGHYVLLCNFTGHYQAGQYAAFQVKR
jgi:uncharacterized cupredoxin-like copper-binding protein